MRGIAVLIRWLFFGSPPILAALSGRDLSLGRALISAHATFRRALLNFDHPCSRQSSLTAFFLVTTWYSQLGTRKVGTCRPTSEYISSKITVFRSPSDSALFRAKIQGLIGIIASPIIEKTPFPPESSYLAVLPRTKARDIPTIASQIFTNLRPVLIHIGLHSPISLTLRPLPSIPTIPRSPPSIPTESESSATRERP